MSKSEASIYQIKVALRHIAPPVWRRIEVPGNIKLGQLHDIIQIVMGWTDSHLHAFHVGRVTYGVPDPDALVDMEMENERNVRLNQIAAEGDKLIYEYDFGDGWEHELGIEKIFPAEKGKRYPRCIAGKRACPPEDCGGPPATSICSTHCATRSTRNTKRCANGSALNSTPRRSTSTMSTKH